MFGAQDFEPAPAANPRKIGRFARECNSLACADATAAQAPRGGVLPSDVYLFGGGAGGGLGLVTVVRGLGDWVGGFAGASRDKAGGDDAGLTMAYSVDWFVDDIGTNSTMSTFEAGKTMAETSSKGLRSSPTSHSP